MSEFFFYIVITHNAIQLMTIMPHILKIQRNDVKSEGERSGNFSNAMKNEVIFTSHSARENSCADFPQLSNSSRLSDSTRAREQVAVAARGIAARAENTTGRRSISQLCRKGRRNGMSSREIYKGLRARPLPLLHPPSGQFRP